MSFKPYPKYKESGVEWLGRVPEHWTVMPVRLAARLESGHTPSRNHPEYWEDCSIPWFTLADVWQIREGGINVVTDTKEKVSDLGIANSAARVLPAGTVMLSRTASVGFSAIMGIDMATTQDFANWVCGLSLTPLFLLQVFRAMGQEFRRLMMGSTHNTIYMPDIASLRFALPTALEQASIVAFVDHETTKIDALIAEQQRLIELLQEKRQAVISHAVTKGLNPDAPMKDSRIEWLGKVPERWGVVKIGHLLAEPPKNGLSPEITPSGTTPTFSIAAVRSGRVDIEPHLKYCDVSLDKASQYFVTQGDVLVLRGSGSKDLVGTAGVVIDAPPSNCIYPDILIRLKPSREVSRWYLVQTLNCPIIRPQVVVAAQTAAGIWKLAGGELREIRMPLPPLAEQLEIEASVLKAAEAADDLIATVEASLTLLQERRSALISAAVTGQIDVRGFSSGGGSEAA